MPKKFAPKISTPTLGFRPQTMFFDRPNVIRSVDRKIRRPLMRIGALVRTNARRSIRPARRKKINELRPDEYALYRAFRRKKKKYYRPWAPSKPGEPPRSHVGLLRDHIYFAYDASRRGVVIGPARLQRRDNGVPGTLEYGGPTEFTWGPNKGRAYIKARPYMRPAYTKARPQVDGILRDFLRR